MALTLLELVSRAVQQEDGAATTDSVWSTRLEPSVAQTSDFDTNKEGQEEKDAVSQYLEDLIVRKDPGGWKVSAPNAAQEDKLVKKLKKKLENVGTFSTNEFIAMVRPALELVLGWRSEIQNPDENGTVDDEKNEEGVSDEKLFLKLLRKGGSRVGQRLLAAIINCILGLQFWSALKVLIEKGLVTSVSHRDLVQKLVDHRKARLLCLSFNYVLDLSPSDLLVALKFLLDQSLVSLDEFEDQRKSWRKAASAAIDTAVRRREGFIRQEKETIKSMIKKDSDRRKRWLVKQKRELAKQKAELAMAMGLEDGSINEGGPGNEDGPVNEEEQAELAMAVGLEDGSINEDGPVNEEEQAELAMAVGLEDGSINEDAPVNEEKPFNNDAAAPVEDNMELNLPLEVLEIRSKETLEMNMKEPVSNAFVLAMATDGFQGWEFCLHTLLSSGQDEAILAAIIAELDTSEAVRLLQYLLKWLDRYCNRLCRHPNPHRNEHKPAHSVPSSQTVIQWINMVLDGQYTKCVLSPEILPELRAIQEQVKAAVAIGSKIAPMIGTVDHIRNKRPLPILGWFSAARSNYTIEYLDIS